MQIGESVYMVGNPWQKKVYLHMSGFLKAKGVISFGRSANGNKFKHLLTKEQADCNFVTKAIYTATLKRFEKHKAGDLNRILTNTAASQTYCFNLIIYLQEQKALANKLFSNLLGKEVQVQHLEPEFTPNECDSVKGFERKCDESIGDQNLNQGTDADIAVFYTYANEKKGILLIEFKFIEAEFSICSSYRKKPNIRMQCMSSDFLSVLIDK